MAVISEEAYKDAQAKNDISRNVRQYSDLDLFFGKKAVGGDVNKITDILAVKRSLRNLLNLNTFEIMLAYLDLNKKELIAKDIGLNFKILESSENEPRLKGRSLISNKDSTIVKKGSLTF